MRLEIVLYSSMNQPDLQDPQGISALFQLYGCSIKWPFHRAAFCQNTGAGTVTTSHCLGFPFRPS